MDHFPASLLMIGFEVSTTRSMQLGCFYTGRYSDLLGLAALGEEHREKSSCSSPNFLQCERQGLD